MSRRLRVYVGVTLLAALALLAANVPPMLHLDWGHFVAWTQRKQQIYLFVAF